MATTNSTEGTSWVRWLRRRLSLVVACLLFVAVVASSYVLLLAQHSGDHTAFAAPVPPSHGGSPEKKAVSDKTGLGQFPPNTDAERELEKMLRGKGDDIDLALANWLIAADIPEFHDLTREAYFAQLKAILGVAVVGLAGVAL